MPLHLQGNVTARKWAAVLLLGWYWLNFVTLNELFQKEDLWINQMWMTSKMIYRETKTLNLETTPDVAQLRAFPTLSCKAVEIPKDAAGLPPGGDSSQVGSQFSQPAVWVPHWGSIQDFSLEHFLSKSNLKKKKKNSSQCYNTYRHWKHIKWKKPDPTRHVAQNTHIYSHRNIGQQLSRIRRNGKLRMTTNGLGLLLTVMKGVRIR